MSTLPNRAPISTPGWVVVIVRDQRLRHLLLSILQLAGFAHKACTTLAEAEQVLRGDASARVILFDADTLGEEHLRGPIQELLACLPPATSPSLLVFSLLHPPPRVEQVPGVTEIVPRPFDVKEFLKKMEALIEGFPG